MSDFKKYSDIERLGKSETSQIVLFGDDDIIIEEKVDGGNGSFWIDSTDNKLHFGSRNNDLTLNEDIKTFHVQRDALIETLNDKIDLISKNYIYYVEWMQKHTVNYGENMLKFIGLDIRLKPLDDEEAPKFLLYYDKVKEFEKLGIPVTTLKWRGKAKDVNEDLLKELISKSSYYNGLPEGVVIKNYGRINQYGRQIFAKVVNDGFQEHVKSKTNKVRPSDDTGLIVDEFVTEARVNKRILSLITEGGQELEMGLMRFLPMQVVKDIFKEESEWILKNCKIVNFNSLKGLVAKKCVVFLGEFINKKALEK